MIVRFYVARAVRAGLTAACKAGPNTRLLLHNAGVDVERLLAQVSQGTVDPDKFGV